MEQVQLYRGDQSQRDYDVYLNYNYYDDTGTTSYDFNLGEGSYSTYVIANHTHVETNPNPKYLPSTKSNSVSFGTLGSSCFNN